MNMDERSFIVAYAGPMPVTQYSVYSTHVWGRTDGRTGGLIACMCVTV